MGERLDASVLVIAWDVGHNCLGRAYMLADALQRVARHVVLAGFQFPRYGKSVWAPLQSARIPTIVIPGENFPQFQEQLHELAGRMQADIVVACKPRLPSLQLGAMIKQRHGSLLLLDIDDHELSFFPGLEPAGLEALTGIEPTAESRVLEPYEGAWTSICEGLIGLADEHLVSNTALQRRFGGVLVPHVRDERAFSSQRVDRKAMRQAYGISDRSKVVLFLGTPRRHKGLLELATAIGSMKGQDVMLVIVGTITERGMAKSITQSANGKVKFIPNQPFERVPEVMSMADLVCLPQDPDHPISRYQLPAKAVDAAAMGVKLLVTWTPPLQDLIAARLAEPIVEGNLAAAISSMLARRSESARRTRKRFLARFSYRAAGETLRRTLGDRLADASRSPLDDLDRLLAQERRMFGQAGPAVASSEDALGTDVVMFWKQNDSGIYGRRFDHVVRHLAARSDVRRVLVLDAPISERKLRALRTGIDLTQERLIYCRTYEKHFGLFDSGKVRYDVHIYRSLSQESGERVEREDQIAGRYMEYVARAMLRTDIEPSRAVFLIYPKNFHGPALIERFRPAVVVTDVVDDHRAWPNQSARERDRLTENYRHLLERSDFAFANCEPVLRTMLPFFPGMELVPNGCDKPGPIEDPVDSPAFDEFASLRMPIIGFVGNLEAKIDIDLLRKIAERFPECHLALIGSTHANASILQLSRLANVKFYGVIPREAVAAWASRFTVGIIPHLDSELTRSMHPLKFYDYVSWGLPIVSTSISNIDRAAGFLRVGATHQQFLEAVAETLRDPRVDPKEVAVFLEENSWEARLAMPMSRVLDLARDRNNARRI